MPFNM